ncbi:hypothetical protein BV375_01300 [Nostoc sp. 106C]|nr:hypothetical protein BV375_01300 [Nostoc sp. 106C]
MYQKIMDALPLLIPFHKKYDVDVGWVEERNPTVQSLVIVGFHTVQTPLHSSRETRPREWLPNLRICLIFSWNW